MLETEVPALMAVITDETRPTDVTKKNLPKVQLEGFKLHSIFSETYLAIIRRNGQSFAHFVRKIRLKYGHDNVRIGVPPANVNQDLVGIYVRTSSDSSS
jgi:hypothetical protein